MSEEMKNNENLEAGSENTAVEGSKAEGNEEKKEKTFTRDELNKIINAEKNNLKAEIEKEFIAKQNEAEKLAKMDAEQKMKYNLKKFEQEKQDALDKLNAYQLKDEAMKIAKEKNMDIGLLDTIDYSRETAESITLKMEQLDLSFKKAVENAVNERLRERSPKNVQNNNAPSRPIAKRASF
jgi:hypothetical protein